MEREGIGIDLLVPWLRNYRDPRTPSAVDFLVTSRIEPDLASSVTGLKCANGPSTT